jgi:carotenoid cleavage dioxygenase-like enzyme
VANAFPDHPYLKGHHAPLRIEADAPDLIVEGDIPDDLAGIFYRTGAEPLHPPIGGQYHWFDGDGMVYAFHIADGRVSMRNRWVRTEKFLAERKAGRRLFGMFGDPRSTDPSVAGQRYNTANTNIVLHGGKLLALMEGAPAVEMDPTSLATHDYLDYGGTITTTFSAHPTIDTFSGEMLNLGAMINGPTGKPEIRYDLINADGAVTKTAFFDAPYMCPMHTFLASANWVVFPFTPIETNVQRAMKGGPMTAWVKNRPTRFALMPRNGDTSRLRWLDMDPRHMFHELNVWEEGDKLIADVATAAGTALFPFEDGSSPSHAETALSLRRWTFDLSGKTDVVTEEVLNDRDIQFPRPDDRLMTRKTRHGFANVNLTSADGRVDGMDAVMRFDTSTGAEDIHHFGRGAAAGELIFAPRIGSKDEADGYAMTLVHPPHATHTELAIFSAQDIAAGPIARAVIPYLIPSGFHCNFYASDSAAYQSAHLGSVPFIT